MYACIAFTEESFPEYFVRFPVYMDSIPKFEAIIREDTWKYVLFYENGSVGDASRLQIRMEGDVQSRELFIGQLVHALSREKGRYAPGVIVDKIVKVREVVGDGDGDGVKSELWRKIIGKKANIEEVDVHYKVNFY